MPIGSFSANNAPEARKTCSDYALPDSKGRIDHSPEPNSECQEVSPPQDEAVVIPTPRINTLPTEIILRIFEFTYYLWQVTPINRERLAREHNVREILAFGYPELLSHVCSFWREIVLASPILWTDLELCSFDESSQTFLSRCSAFVPRAPNQDFVLNIRLYHSETKRLATTRTAMEDFCSSISSRLRSLRIDNHSPNDATFLSSIIQAGLLNTTPGTLTQLYIADHWTRAISTQNDLDNGDSMVGWELPSAEAFGISQDLLDSLVRPIRFLRLNGLFFPWTSPAYHGLTGLHLQFTYSAYGRKPFIHGFQLRQILLACPELCTFHINIDITGQGISQDLTPVPLNNLEELNLRGLSRNAYEIILPLLAPGSRPLRFIFQTQYETRNPVLYCPLITSFFRRSNVTSLFVLGRHSVSQYLDFSQLLAESPTNLAVLGLQRLRVPGLESMHVDHSKILPPIRLKRLYLRRCTFTVETLKHLAEFTTVQMVKIYEPSSRVLPDEDKAKLHQEIALIFPTVKWVCSSLDMEWWEMFGMKYED